MGDHIHEWSPRFLGWDYIDGVECDARGCDAEMDNKEMSRRLNERDDLQSLLLRLRNFIVKAEGHHLYGEKWTDWVDPALPEDMLVD